MGRRNADAAADRPEGSEPDPAGAQTLDLSEVPAYQLRDRLDAHRDGREERVVAAARELRASLDRLGAGIAARREALTTRAGEMVRAAAPMAGGVAVAGVGVALVVRRSRRPRPAPPLPPLPGTVVVGRWPGSSA